MYIAHEGRRRLLQRPRVPAASLSSYRSGGGAGHFGARGCRRAPRQEQGTPRACLDRTRPSPSTGPRMRSRCGPRQLNFCDLDHFVGERAPEVPRTSLCAGAVIGGARAPLRMEVPSRAHDPLAVGAPQVRKLARGVRPRLRGLIVRRAFHQDGARCRT